MIGDRSRPRCSIVIRAYNEEHHIGRLLAGILEQTERSVEILLVDSGSTDATLAIASRYPVRILTIAPEAFTFGRSLNIGIAEARGEFVVMASAHVYPVYPDWLEQLLRPFVDPDIALVYGKQRGNSTTKYSEGQHLAKLFPETSDLNQTHPFCNNANAAIRRELWVQQAYDEELPGLEDLAWASWAVDQGLSLAYSAEAEVIHVHDESPQQVYNRYRREAMALKRIRPAETFRLLDFVRLVLSNVLSDARHAAREGVLGRVWREILWFRFMQFWGTYRGFALSGPLTSQLKQTFYYPRRFSIEQRSVPRDMAPISYGSILDSPRDEPVEN